ncbi:MAG: amidase family protein [Sphingomonadaceae bacterium]
MPDELWRWDAVRLAGAIQARDVSCRDAVSACLERLNAINPRVNAVVETLADEALAAAEHADRQLSDGNPVGLLHGVPVTTKINTDQKGCPTSNGVKAFANLIAEHDSPSIANLRRAGAIIIGRTNCPEFSWRWFTDNDLYGETINPWSREYTCGGSSGGAAVAVATGIGPVAHGSDFGGSIRHPALCCGVAGLRPSLGRVPAFNASAGDRPITAQFMAVHGPLARRVGDLRLAFSAMTMGDIRDPWWVPAPLQGAQPPSPIRVAMMDSDRRPGLDTGIADALDQAARWLQDAGYIVEQPANAPSIEEAAHLWSTLVLNEAKLSMIEVIRQHGGSAIRKTGELMINQAPATDFAAYLKALGRRATILREWQVFLERYPLVLMPVCRAPAYQLGLDQRNDAAMKRIFDDMAPILAPAVLGLPGIAVPTGVGNPVPLGVQIVAGRFREDLCLDAAEAIEHHAGVLTPINPF